MANPRTPKAWPRSVQRWVPVARVSSLPSTVVMNNRPVRPVSDIGWGASPSADQFTSAKQAASDAADARTRGQRTNLYVVFAGHGNARRGRAYVTLEDARLYPEDILRDVVDVVAPGQAHVIIDACHSYLFAMARGPGGTHRPLRGFLDRSLRPRMAKVGFLLSSSQSGESHEWEAFQSGVFSHEVRSGLVGAADVDGDGTISYREIAAFVARANAAIVNERYRPTVYARSPPGAEVLLDLRSVRASRLHVDGRTGGKHFLVEDARGVRWSDFHVRLGQALNLLLPEANRPLYVRNLVDRQESVVTETHQQVILSEQASKSPWKPPRTPAQPVPNTPSNATLPASPSAASAWSTSSTSSPPTRARSTTSASAPPSPTARTATRSCARCASPRTISTSSTRPASPTSPG